MFCDAGGGEDVDSSSDVVDAFVVDLF